MLHTIKHSAASCQKPGGPKVPLSAKRVPGMLFCPECVEISKGNPS